MNIQEIWTKTLAQIEVKLDSPAQFKTWFKDTSLINIDGKYATIQVKNPYTADWLQNRHEKMIRDTLSYVAGKTLNLKFAVNGSISEVETQDELDVDDNQALPILSQDRIYADLSRVLIDSGLSTKYNMNNYIVGESNRMAHAAGLAVIDEPGTTYNPLFIFGPSGVGKTHLAQAVGSSLVEKNANRKVIYSPAEGFLNDMVKAIRKGKNLEFKQKYRKIDCLIIDDIQYISTWEKTQDEFFNTFNELYNANKQIILVSDRRPEDIKTIDNRLKSRFMGGLTVEISRPDFAMRMAVLENKAKEKGIEFNPYIYEFLAKSLTENIRELEGAVQKISLYSTMKPEGNELTLNEIAKIVGIDAESRRGKFSVSTILKAVADEFNVSVKDIKGPRRTAEVALARQVAMYILRDEYEYKLEKIAALLKRQDHTTVIHAIDKVKSKIALSDGFSEQIIRLKNKIRESN